MKTLILLTGLFLVVWGVQMITGAHQAAAGVLARKVRALRRRLAGRSFPARAVAATARRMPRGVEPPAAAGSAPGLAGPGASRRQVLAHADAMRAVSVPRPVNGRSRGTQPHIAIPPGHPPWLTAPMPVIRVTDDRPFEHPGDGTLPPVALCRPYLPGGTS